MRAHPATERLVGGVGLKPVDDHDAVIRLADGVEDGRAVATVLRLYPQLTRLLEAVEEVVRITVEADDHRDWICHPVLLVRQNTCLNCRERCSQSQEHQTMGRSSARGYGFAGRPFRLRSSAT